MSDDKSKKLAKKLKKKRKKKNPNRKLKRNIVIVGLIFLGFILSTPLSAFTQKSSFGSLSKIGDEVKKDNDISVKLASASVYEKAQLAEADVLIDLAPSQLDTTFKFSIYGSDKKQIKDVKVERINANYYTLFIPKSNPKNFQYYLAIQQKGVDGDKVMVGNLTKGFIFSTKNATHKSAFKVQTSSHYVAESRKLLAQKYDQSIKDIEAKIKNNNQQMDDMKSKNEKLLNNASGLTDDEKKEVADQITSNNATVTGLKSNNADLEKSKEPIKEKIEALKTLSN